MGPPVAVVMPSSAQGSPWPPTRARRWGRARIVDHAGLRSAIRKVDTFAKLALAVCLCSLLIVVLCGAAAISAPTSAHVYDPAEYNYDGWDGISPGPTIGASHGIGAKQRHDTGSSASGQARRGVWGVVGSFVAPSPARFCSFSAVTEVLMADGTTKPISAVEIGDWVLAEDPETGERGARQVTHLWVHEDTIIDLEIAGHDVATTEDHPFWNHTDNEWQRADALDTGDLVLTADGDLLAVNGMRWGSTRTTTAYNLTVDDIHTYYVVAGGEEVLVHNVCGDDLVSDILKTKKGSIRNAELPSGAPSWDEILDMPFSQIEAGARANLPGYRTIKKLLTDGRFNR